MFLPPSGSWDRRRGLVRSEKLGTSPRRVPRPVQERGRLRHGHRIGLADLPQYLIHAALLPIRPRRTYATTVSQSPPGGLWQPDLGLAPPAPPPPSQGPLVPLCGPLPSRLEPQRGALLSAGSPDPQPTCALA